MINFVQTSPARVRKFHKQYSANAGYLCTPYSGHRIESEVAMGMLWAMDNGCFKGYNPKAIIHMMQRYRGIPNCMFMTAPDVVGNHEETLLLFRAWLGTIQSYGYPVAFVLQNGACVNSIPWDSIAAVFIGGDNAFKKSDEVAEIVVEAKKRGKWVHMGRVNTPGRIRYARTDLECDSIDGSSFVIAPQVNITKHAPHYAGDKQLSLWRTK